jgi:hypothetical protein
MAHDTRTQVTPPRGGTPTSQRHGSPHGSGTAASSRQASPADKAARHAGVYKKIKQNINKFKKNQASPADKAILHAGVYKSLYLEVNINSSILLHLLFTTRCI